MVNKVIEIVRNSSEIMMKRVFEVEDKDGASNSVTSADIEVESYLKKNLADLIVDCGFICEESTEEVYCKEYIWVIDPIDGTKNFIRELGFSGISVGLLKNGVPILGVIYNPYTEEMYHAKKGNGAYLNEKRISVSNNDIEHSLLCTAMSLYDKDLSKHCFNIIEEVYAKCDDIRRFGSAVLELASLACGRTDLYFEIRVFPWDFTAGQIIIEEAGGVVGTIGYDKPIYNRPIPLICANTQKNYDYLMEVILKEIPVIPYKS